MPDQCNTAPQVRIVYTVADRLKMLAWALLTASFTAFVLWALGELLGS
jgi:hypothetical protein